MTRAKKASATSNKSAELVASPEATGSGAPDKVKPSPKKRAAKSKPASEAQTEELTLSPPEAPDGKPEPKKRKAPAKAKSRSAAAEKNPEGPSSAEELLPSASAEAAGEEDGTEKPKKKRKPTAKQLEEAEAAARPRYDPATDRPPPCTDKATTILGWNVTSLNATLRKDPEAISRLAADNAADVICLQETKLQDKATDEFSEKLNLPGWHYHWACSQTKKGYSGTASFSKEKPVSVQKGMGGLPEHDDEGRVITLEFGQFYLVNVYTPNAGEGLKRLTYKIKEWDPAFNVYIANLKAKKPVVITGDLNCAHQAIDIHSPRTNLKSAGYTPEERESFGKGLESLELTDCFRRQYPDHVGYTWWSIRTGARKSNKGWRLDYFLVTPELVEKCYDCFILKDYGAEKSLGDHCPVGLVLTT